MKVKIEIISVHTLGQDSNDRRGFDLLSFLVLDIHLVISVRLKVVFSDSYKLVNIRSETKD